MKRFILIAILFAALLGVTACQTSTGGSVSTPLQPTKETFTPSEQAIYNYCSANIDMLAKAVKQEDAIPQNYTNETQLENDIQPIADEYGVLCDSYNATNGGEYAGGRVANLESLWEKTSKNVQTVLKAYIAVIVDPTSVDTTQTGYALANADQGIEDIRTELNSLSQYSQISY